MPPDERSLRLFDARYGRRVQRLDAGHLATARADCVDDSTHQNSTSNPSTWMGVSYTVMAVQCQEQILR